MWIFAHRGASGQAPENTLKSITVALELGCDGIEIDVHEVDGQLVVIHDPWLQQTTNGHGHIKESDFNYIRSLDAGAGETVPTLREVLNLVNGRAMLNIEVKSIATERAVLSEIDYAVETLNFSNQQLILSSFNHHILAEAKQLRPATQIGALTASIPIHYAKFAEDLQAYSVHPCIEFVNQAFVDDAHARGLKVFVYTVNAQADLALVKKLNVDGVFTNL